MSLKNGNIHDTNCTTIFQEITLMNDIVCIMRWSNKVRYCKKKRLNWLMLWSNIDIFYKKKTLFLINLCVSLWVLQIFNQKIQYFLCGHFGDTRFMSSTIFSPTMGGNTPKLFRVYEVASNFLWKKIQMFSKTFYKTHSDRACLSVKELVSSNSMLLKPHQPAH